MDGAPELFIFKSTLGLVSSYGLGPFLPGQSVLRDLVCFILPQTALILLPMYLDAIVAVSLLLSVLRFTRSLLSRSRRPPEPMIDSAGRLSYFDNFRASVMLMIVVCIFGVDFDFFDRRHEKTKFYGLSLMDVGVGSMVYTSGIVSARSHSMDMKSIIVVGLFGVARCVAIHLSGYNFNVQEYGVHWNFYFTLFCVFFVSSLLFRMKLDGIVSGGLCTLIHGIFLAQWGKNFILNAPRTSLVSMNKEGLFSIPGYLAIFLVARGIGIVLFAHRSQRQRLVFFGLVAALFCILFFVLKKVEEPSRMMANPTFVVWIIALHSVHVVVGLIVSSIVYIPVLPLAKLISRNQLTVFVCANIIIGVINLSTNVRTFSLAKSVIVLILYLVCTLYSPILINRVLSLLNGCSKKKMNDTADKRK